MEQVVAALPREEAEAAMIDFLRSAEHTGLADYGIRWVARQINAWHGTDLGGIGADLSRKGYDQPGCSDSSLLRDVLVWHETGVDPGVIPPDYRPAPEDLRIVWVHLKDGEKGRVGLWLADRDAEGPLRMRCLTSGKEYLAYRIALREQGGRQAFRPDLWFKVGDDRRRAGDFIAAEDLPARIDLSSDDGAAPADWDVWIERAASPESVLSDTGVFREWAAKHLDPAEAPSGAADAP